MPVNSSANTPARSSSKKTPAKKAATSKTPAKKTPAKKAATSKAPAKKAATAKKATAQKATAKQATATRATSRLTAPHLVEPTLKDVTPRSYRSYHSAVSRGFQEPDRDEVAELDKDVFEFDRSFGFAVGSRWVSTCAAFSRSISVPGGAEVPAAAVTVVTVHPPFRRTGLLRKMMQHQLEDVARRGEPLATLWASESLIYGRFGYAPAVSGARLSGHTRRLQFLPGVTTSGSVDEVSREQFLAVVPGLHTAARAERPGWLNRDHIWWKFATFDLEFARNGATPYRYVLHYNDSGDVDGYAFYRFKEDFADGEPNGEVRIGEVQADDPQAYAGLWRYLLDLDLARRFTLSNAPVDEPLRHLVADARAVRTEVSDNIYIRVVDVAAALAARRYAAEIDLVLEVSDAMLPDNNGRFRLQGGPDHAEVTRAPRSRPDLSLSVLELGAAYLGGVPLHELHRVGRITEHTADAVAAASTAFGWHRQPWCPDHF